MPTVAATASTFTVDSVDTLMLADDLDDPAGLEGEILAAAARHGTRVVFVRQDMRYRLDGITLAMYAPLQEGNVNERCLTARVSLGRYDTLVTGDIDREAEQALLEAHALSGTELLIVSHHGSRSASSWELLRGIGAREAVISCGYNTYGHPNPETLERLAKCGYTVYRTDEDGTIELRIGESYG